MSSAIFAAVCLANDSYPSALVQAAPPITVAQDNTPLAQLEALACNPRLCVAPEQRPRIVAEILHHLMHPYFLNRTPEMREKFSEANYHAFMKALESYCLREYIEHPEPRLIIDFIKGLHRQFYWNAPSVPVKAVDGSMTTMVPGEFRNIPMYMRAVTGEWLAIQIAPEDVSISMTLLVERCNDSGVPIFRRYLQLMFELAFIHPFHDGNGKVAMLLGDLFLLKQGLQPPYFSRYRWSSKDQLYGQADAIFARAGSYTRDTQWDFSGVDTAVVGLYKQD